jgi:hypothetical protein
MKSVQQIPDYNKRATYLLYVKDGFSQHRHLPLNSREAITSYRDGLEQVESMEYYQRMARIKHNGNGTMISQSTGAAATTSVASESISTSSSPRNNEVEKWLLSHLPHLHKDDVTKYTKQLVDDGFDSVPFIDQELSEDDLQFMKKAHRRVLMRQLNEQRRND